LAKSADQAGQEPAPAVKTKEVASRRVFCMFVTSITCCTHRARTIEVQTTQNLNFNPDISTIACID